MKEGSRLVVVNQFSSDFNIAEAISDDNLDKDSLFHSDINIRKVDRNKENQR
jgi:hypothetical protein